MNAQDRKQIDKLFDKIEEVNKSIEVSEKNSLKMYYKIDKILNTLEDDPNSNSIGLITKVNQMEKDVENLVNSNLLVKRASVFLLTIAGGIITFIIKSLISKNV